MACRSRSARTPQTITKSGWFSYASRPDLIWDDEARGLCSRLYSDGSKSFIFFVYRIGDRQRYIRIGSSHEWSLKVARNRAKEQRSIVDQGRDPATDERDRRGISVVDRFLRYVAEAKARSTAEKAGHPSSEQDDENVGGSAD